MILGEGDAPLGGPGVGSRRVVGEWERGRPRYYS